MTIAAQTSRAIPAIADDVPESQRSRLQRALIFCRRQPLGSSWGEPVSSLII
jgi:hypothetical protein